MNKETANYIIRYFGHLMSDNEKLAMRHYSSTIKLSDNDNSQMVKIYQERGWLTDKSAIHELLKNGFDEFEIVTAKRIIEQSGDKVFFNNCPKCGKLSRTPTAKQCRYCGHKWYDRKEEK